MNFPTELQELRVDNSLQSFHHNEWDLHSVSSLSCNVFFKYQPDVYVVFIIELNVCLWPNFMVTVVGVKVLPICNFDATGFILVHF
jgi:hypothetical protein